MLNFWQPGSAYELNLKPLYDQCSQLHLVGKKLCGWFCHDGKTLTIIHDDCVHLKA